MSHEKEPWFLLILLFQLPLNRFHDGCGFVDEVLQVVLPRQQEEAVENAAVGIDADERRDGGWKGLRTRYEGEAEGPEDSLGSVKGAGRGFAVRTVLRVGVLARELLVDRVLLLLCRRCRIGWSAGDRQHAGGAGIHKRDLLGVLGVHHPSRRNRDRHAVVRR